MPIQALYQQKYNRQPSLSEILSPALWYDASDSSTVTLSGGTVTAWANKGATSGYDLSLNSGSPTYTATQNGLNVMTYDGTDRMVTTQLNSVTHIFVASAWSAAGAVSTNYNGFLSSNSYDWHGDNSADLVASGLGAAWVTSQPTQSTSQLDGSNFVNIVDDKWTTFSIYSINLQSGYTGGFNGTGYGNGSSRVFLGDYGEIIVYQTDYLTTDQINTITGYLANKWGSQSLLPSEHPYRAESPFFRVDSYPLKFSAKRPTPTTVTKTKISTNRIVTDGLVLNLDAGYRASYNGTGDTWFDVSGNGNNGTLVNGVGYTADNGGALTFDGVNDYVTIPSSTLELDTDTNFTLEYWVYTSTSGLAPTVTVNAGTSKIIAFFINDVSFSTFYTILSESNYPGSGNSNALRATTNISTNTWTHVSIVRLSGTITIYMNGVASGSVSNSYSSRPLNLIGAIAQGGAPNLYFLNGNISNVRIYKGKGLTAAEVQQNFNLLKGRYGL